jgi:uncharacterized protein (TIGR02466 family)
MSQINLLFSTPLYSKQLADNEFVQVQKEIAAILTQAESVSAEVPSWGDTVKTDYHYRQGDNTANFIEKYRLTYLKNSIVNSVHEYAKGLNYEFYNPIGIRESWINFNYRGGYQNSHAHAGSVLSGCYYYCSTGQDGDIIFENPNTVFQSSLDFPLNTSVNTLNHQMPTASGLLLLFPSWLRHRVNVNRSDSTRVSIAFNIVP